MDAIEIHDGIIFIFYSGSPHVCMCVSNTTGIQLLQHISCGCGIASMYACIRAESVRYEGVALQGCNSDWEGYVRSNPEWSSGVEGSMARGFSTAGKADSAAVKR